MKKVLITASTWGHFSHFHLPYLQALHENGWTVHIACADAPPKANAVDVCYNMPFRKKITALGNFKIAYQLRKIIKQEQFDLIITHTSLAAFFTRFALLFSKQRPKVINMVHGYLFDDASSRLKKLLYVCAERLVAPVTDLILTMNQWDFQFAQAHKFAKHVENIPGIGGDFTNFCPGKNETLRAELGIPENGVALIYPAEFSKRKNQQLLIRAMTQLPQHVHLLLLGEGALRSECTALAKTLDVSNRVHFPGYINNLQAWYHAADISVSSSRIEGLPFNILEGMACGLPVIASDVKGNQDLASICHIGVVYPYNDEAAYVRAVLQLLETDRSLALKNRQMVTPYALENVLEKVMALYNLPCAPQERIPLHE